MFLEMKIDALRLLVRQVKTNKKLSKPRRPFSLPGVPKTRSRDAGCRVNKTEKIKIIITTTTKHPNYKGKKKIAKYLKKYKKIYKKNKKRIEYLTLSQTNK